MASYHYYCCLGIGDWRNYSLVSLTRAIFLPHNTCLVPLTDRGHCHHSDIYAPPFYARTMVGYGVNYNAPRPPFILFKLMWRSPLGLLLKPIWYVVRTLYNLAAGEFGAGKNADTGPRVKPPYRVIQESERVSMMMATLVRT